MSGRLAVVLAVPKLLCSTKSGDARAPCSVQAAAALLACIPRRDPSALAAVHDRKDVCEWVVQYAVL